MKQKREEFRLKPDVVERFRAFMHRTADRHRQLSLGTLRRIFDDVLNSQPRDYSQCRDRALSILTVKLSRC